MLLLFRHFSLLLVAALAAIVTACSNDDSPADKTMRADGKVPVKLHISVAGQGDESNSATRAPGDPKWEDENATDDEMMNVWTVVAVHSTDDTKSPERFKAGDIAFIFASKPDNPKREIDDINHVVYLEPGEYDFYNFANIDPIYATKTILGIPTIEDTFTKVKPDGSFEAPVAIPESFFSTFVQGPGQPGQPGQHDVYSLSWGSTNVPKITQSVVAAKTIQVKGNGFDPTATNNGFNSKGIPMSNHQHFIISQQMTCDLIVVRTLAKIKLQIQNSGTTPVTITTASLTDITDNNESSTTHNLMLLPQYTNSSSANTMEFVHKDIRPNLVENAKKGNYTHTVNKTIAGGATDEITFYVNESVAPIDDASATTGNGSGLFYLSLGIKTGLGQEVVYSHALINQQGHESTYVDEDKNDDGAWHYIARNDYRVIPVILSDWLFRVEPLAFVPIAGYPAVTLSSDAQKATFKTGGIIALQPFVKKRTETNWRDFSDPEVTYGTTVNAAGTETPDEEASWNASITWTNSDGINVSGTDKIIKTPFVYDPVAKCIIGELNNNLTGGPHKTAVTITVKLGPATGPQYTYSFTCDVILDKRTTP